MLSRRSCLALKALLQVLVFSAVTTSLSQVTPAPGEDDHFPADAIADYRQASQSVPSASSDVAFLENQGSITLDPAGNTTSTRFYRYKILTAKGAEEWSSIALVWRPWSGHRPRIRARVITSDGVVHELDEKTITDATPSANDNNLYSDVHVLRAPLPAVAPGSLVEEEFISEESASFDGAGFLQRIYLASSVAIQHTRLTVDMPANMPFRYDVRLMPDLKPTRTEESGRVRLVFEHGPIAPNEDIEPDTPLDEPVFPSLTISGGTLWQNLANKYGEIVNKQIAADLPGGLFELKKSRDEQIASVLRFIDQQVRYTGVEFDDASVVPRTPAEVLKRKYGDCKDKAALLIAMLRSVKIPAYMALLRVADREDLSAELAGMGMFDHAIVFVPGKRDLWIDATDDHARMGVLPAGDQGRLALIVRPESNALVRIPVAPSSDNLLLEKRELRLSEYGPAQITEVSQPHGSQESNYRRLYTNPKDKNIRESLITYFKGQYLADDIDQIDRSDPEDLSTQFELTMKSLKARRGNTELNGAVAAIRLEGIFSRLPAELRQRQTAKKGDESQKKRIHPYQLPEASVTEWHYTIVPPLGFVPKPLPQDSDAALGPAQFSKKFQADKDGIVHVTLKFDTVKQRMTPAEGDALRDTVLQIQEAPILIYFEPIAQTLIAQGKLLEADQSYRDLIAKHLNEAVLHIRLAKMLLGAGLGKAARKEAQYAVQLEPNSLMAQKELAQILEYDLVGRKFRLGSDYKGAEAALRAALKIDPKDDDTISDLAMLLERNQWGLQFGVGANLKGAIEEYRKLTPEVLGRYNIQNNLPYALFYDGQFAESQHAAETLDSPPLSLIVAGEAALKGSEAALALARKRSSSDANFKQIADVAGDLLADMQIYPLAAELKDAGASGDDASTTASYAALYRRTQPHQRLISTDDPASLALKYQLLTQNLDLTVAQLASICSKNGKLGLATEKEVERMRKLEKELRFQKARQGDRPDVGLDLAFTRIQPKTSGNDAVGFKVIAFPGAKYKRSRFVVKEDGHYKLVGTTENPTGVGLEVLDRVASNDLAGAQALLNSFRDELPLQNGDDPLSGWPFSRWWTKGRSADPLAMKVAAALLVLSRSKDYAKTSIEILEEARKTSTRDTDKTNILLGLVWAFQLTEDHPKALEIAKLLVNEYPESEEAFQIETRELMQMNRHAEMDKAAGERLQRIPDDIQAMRTHLEAAMGREDYVAASVWNKKIISHDKASANDLNSAAWNVLFTGKVTQADVEFALKALELSPDETSTMHTLACLYAEMGNAPKATEILLRSMDLLNLDEPNEDYWYAFGRIAELYGEREEALAAYSRVKTPEQPAAIPTSTFKLAQMRLQVLNSTVKHTP